MDYKKEKFIEMFNDWRENHPVTNEFFKMITEEVKKIEDMSFEETCNLSEKERDVRLGVLGTLTEIYNWTGESFFEEKEGEDDK